MQREWTFAELKDLLAAENRRWAEGLLRGRCLRGIGSNEDLGKSAAIEAVPDERGCFCGLLTGANQTAVGLAGKYLITPTRSPKKLHGVLNVLDKGTQHTKQKLPVVVCVGINYGQIPRSVGTPLVDETNMGQRAVDAMALLTGTAPTCDVVLPVEFQLVATNVFPWLSIREWSAMGLNSIEEALLLHCFGDPDPVERIAGLITTIGVHSVFFHGANNCVSTMALPTVRAANAAGWQGFALLCDNLSRKVTKNVVTLCNHPCHAVNEGGTLDLQE